MKSKLLATLGHLTFWSWNLLFVSVVLFGVTPLVLVGLVQEAIDGFVPVDLALTTLGLVLVPVLSTAAGLMWLRKDPRHLLALYFGVEAPAFLLLLVRTFLVRELTAATTFVLATVLTAGVVYAAGLALEVRGERRASPPRDVGAGLRALALLAHVTCLVTGLYAGSILAFYAVPAAAAGLRAFFGFAWLSELITSATYTSLGGMMFYAMMLALFSLTVVSFVAMPVVMVALYVRRWWQNHQRTAARWGHGPAWALSGGALVACVAAFVHTTKQPQPAVLARLAEPPPTDAERRARLADREQLREGLLNAYLAPYRYVGPSAHDQHITRMFADALGLPEAYGRQLQALFMVLARPVVYQAHSDSGDDRAEAARLYEAFFDQPIQKGEQAAVLRALSATFDRAGREAGLLDTGARKVHLERQAVTLTEHGTHAEIELHEVYASQSYEQEEVSYAFSLPRSAVVTGLWLGDTDDRARRFPYVLAPRGAAQAVYKAEVQRRVDPALLEQVGPSQYRLRAFPVPPKPRGRATPAEGAPTRLHLWLTIQVLPEDEGWPLPRLLERRNVYADHHTERHLGAARLAVPTPEDWLPAWLPARTPTALTGGTFTLSPALALSAEPRPDQPPALRPGQRLAIVLDRSYSMGRHVSALVRSFEWVEQHLRPAHTIDLYLAGSEGRGEGAVRVDGPRGFDPRDVVYYGGQDPVALVADFQRLARDTRYDAVLFLTDEGSYDLARDAEAPRQLGAPVWFVHVGGQLPQGYDDGTLALIEQSGGGVSTSLPEAIGSLALSRAPGVVAVDESYVWRRAEPSTDVAPTRGLVTHAARQALVVAQAQPAPLDVAALDALHSLARRFPQVSPYSSMLVLVNDEQRARLAAAEAAADRFDREVESGSERLSTPAGGFPSITATPEPGEWALLAVLLLMWVVVAKQRGLAPSWG
jgi:putative PEP-CTERM system integral membrane protein